MAQRSGTQLSMHEAQVLLLALHGPLNTTENNHHAVRELEAASITIGSGSQMQQQKNYHFNSRGMIYSLLDVNSKINDPKVFSGKECIIMR